MLSKFSKFEKLGILAPAGTNAYVTVGNRGVKRVYKQLQVCESSAAPSVSSISRILRNKIGNIFYSKHTDDDETLPPSNKKYKRKRENPLKSSSPSTENEVSFSSLLESTSRF